MARRRKKRLPSEPVEAQIESLAHDGRGVTHVDDKVVFVHGALAGERLMFQYTRRTRKQDEGRAVAFAIALPDANRALKTAGGSLLRAGLALKVPPFKVDIDRVRILLLGVREDYRNSGFEAILINEIVRNTLDMDIDRGELSWILEDNVPMRRVLEKSIGAVQYKTYRIYDRNLG